MSVFLLQVLGCWIVLVVLHVTALAMSGASFGIAVLEVAYGFGKVVLRKGRTTLRLLPFGGFVKYKDTREPSAEVDSADTSDAFNHQSRFVQFIVPLVGVSVLVLVAMLFHPVSGFAGVMSGFGQIVFGGLSPLDDAQVHLHATQEIAAQSGFLALLGLMASKFAAFNLLPLPLLNGGQAILPWLRLDRTKSAPWENTVMQISLWLWLPLSAAWIVAFGYFVFGSK